MDRLRSSGDEVWGMPALGALCDGDTQDASEMLPHTRTEYAVAFLTRLALVCRGAMNTAWKLLVRCWSGTGWLGVDRGDGFNKARRLLRA